MTTTDAVWIVGGAAAGILVTLAVYAGIPIGREPTMFSGRVTKIVDGDTFYMSRQSERIRVWGLDAPEWNHSGGSLATKTLAAMIDGQTLECRERDVDRYGRTVGQCFLPDGTDITAAMIESGTATEFCRYSRNHYRTCGFW
jgi:endonuclease YncB( thermonuclease family)